MSANGPRRTVFGDETGADGRALTDTDLNAISTDMSRRAWEVPGYAGLTATDEIYSTNGVQSYASAFECATHANDARKTGVFTVGRGLEPYASNLDVAVGAGFLGSWVDPTGPSYPPVSGTNRMQWVTVKSGDISVNHVAADSGNTRWDVVYVTPSEVNITPAVPRHFQDATTGAITTQNVITGRTATVTVGVVQGTQSTGTPSINAVIPDGSKYLYAALVGSAAISQVRDLTIPVGQLQVGMTLGREGFPSAGQGVSDPVWQPSVNAGTMVYVPARVGDLIVLPPASVRGAVATRLLGLSIAHKLYSGNTVELCSYSQTGAVSTIGAITGNLTINGSVNTDFVAMGQYDPIWTNGDRKKGGTGLSLCLKFNAATSSASEVRSVLWHYVG